MEFHRIHLPAFSSFASGAKWRSFTPQRSEDPTASVVQFVSGIHKKKLGLTITSEKIEGRGRCYMIAEV